MLDRGVSSGEVEDCNLLADMTFSVHLGAASGGTGESLGVNRCGCGDTRRRRPRVLIPVTVNDHLFGVDGDGIPAAPVYKTHAGALKTGTSQEMPKLVSSPRMAHSASVISMSVPTVELSNMYEYVPSDSDR